MIFPFLLAKYNKPQAFRAGLGSGCQSYFVPKDVYKYPGASCWILNLISGVFWWQRPPKILGVSHWILYRIPFIFHPDKAFKAIVQRGAWNFSRWESSMGILATIYAMFTMAKSYRNTNGKCPIWVSRVFVLCGKRQGGGLGKLRFASGNPN